jgi:hypothetical protein
MDDEMSPNGFYFKRGVYGMMKGINIHGKEPGLAMPDGTHTIAKYIISQ